MATGNLKTRVELRIDNDLHADIKALADEADISVNQLIQGVMRWAVKYGHAAEAQYDEHAEIDQNNVPGCVWFGHHSEFVEDKNGQPVDIPAIIYFQLDFTERRVVRDD